MAFKSAQDAGCAFTDSSTTYRNVTQLCDSVTLDRDVDALEVTTFNSSNGVRSYVPGLEGATVSMSGPWGTTMDGYLHGVRRKTKTFHYFPGSTTKTDSNFVHYSGSAILTKYTLETAAADPNTYSADWQWTGVVNRTTTT